jgi:hypothetical protein
MNRREFLSLCAAAPGLARARPPAGGAAWLDAGVVMAGSWEPPTFLLRRGGQEVDAVERWKQERTERSVRNLKEAGVNLVITNLHKGFGLRTEAEDIEGTRAFVQLAHRYDIKVGGYVGGTIMYETFFEEEPDAVNWPQRDEFGHPMYYGWEQTFRYAACRNNPGYHGFVLKVLKLGVVDLRLDLIHFDHLVWTGEPRSCRCEHCREGFRQFLRSRYDEARMRKRFGFTRMDGITPPPFDIHSGPMPFRELRNPVMQEWALFRAYSLAKRFGEYAAYIRSLNPQTAVEGNPNLNLANNQGFTQGVDVAQMLEHADIVWSEERNHAAWMDGRIISKIRSFKSARSMGRSIFIYTGSQYAPNAPESPPELLLAEAMAFNGANLGMVGDLTPDGTNLTPGARRYVRFFQSHIADLAGAVSRADVAVLRAFAAIEFNAPKTNVSTVLFEQTLLQSQIPFDTVLNRHLQDLRRYKVLVLANQDAVSDEEVAAIREFVRKGGGLVATDNSSLFTEWRLRRPILGLADVLGVDLPGDEPVRRTYEAGRAVYIPRVEPAVTPPPPTADYKFTHESWALPLNRDALVQAVRWAAGNQLTVEADTPASVAIELTENKAAGKWLLHLVNFDVMRPARHIAVRFRLPAGARLRQADWESPDEEKAAVLPLARGGDIHSLLLPRLKTYALIRLRLAS